MSGAKRKSQYRKSVTSDYLSGAPAATSDAAAALDVARLAQIRANLGGGSFSAQLADGREIETKLPRKFHNLIWLKSRDLVILDADSAQAEATGSRVVYVIDQILSHDQVKALARRQQLPKVFMETMSGLNAAKRTVVEGCKVAGSDDYLGMSIPAEGEEGEEEEDVANMDDSADHSGDGTGTITEE